MSKNILELTNVTKNFPGVKALDEANFKLKKCKDIETNKVFSYEFFSDLEKVIIGEYNGQLFSYDEIKVKSYDYFDKNFIVFAETEKYHILIC